MSLYLADLEGMSEKDVQEHIAASYECSLDFVKQYKILVAYESVGSWGCDSSSFFILRNKKTNSLSINTGGHCSCYGFEGQFDPEDMPISWFTRDDFWISTGGYDDDGDENEAAIKEWIRKNIRRYKVNDPTK